MVNMILLLLALVRGRGGDSETGSGDGQSQCCTWRMQLADATDTPPSSLGSLHAAVGNMAFARLGSNMCSWGMRLVSPSLQPSQPMSLVGSIIVGVGVIGVIAGVIAGDPVPLDLL